MTSASEKYVDDKGLPLWGRVLLCGATDYGTVGRKGKVGEERFPDLASVHILRALSHVRICKIRTSHSSAHVVFLSVEGNAFVLGRNEHGQLGFKPDQSPAPTTGKRAAQEAYPGAAIHTPAKLRKKDFDPPLPAGRDGDIVEAATGRNHTLLVTRGGDVYTAGQGSVGQLGRSVTKDQFKFVRVDSAGFVRQKDAAVQVAAGVDFSLVLTASGKVYAFGSMESGQLGNGTTGEHIVVAGKTAFGEASEPALVKALAGETVTQIACGQHHAIALTDKGIPWVWGAGGYGRLGLGDGHDAAPTPVQQFDRENEKLKARKIIAGPTASIAIDGQEQYWLAGKWKITGQGGVGQSNMHFAYLLELMGVKVKNAAMGGVTLFIVAEDAGSTSEHGATMNVCWGQNAAHGELGFGEGRPKSATKPQRWEALDGIAVLEIGASQGTTFILARNMGEAYSDLPRFPEEITVESDECQVCGDNSDEASEKRGDLLECEKCDLGYHLKCLDPPLDAVPEGEWHCPVCKDQGLREIGYPEPSKADDPNAPLIDLESAPTRAKRSATNDGKKAPSKKRK